MSIAARAVRTALGVGCAPIGCRSNAGATSEGKSQSLVGQGVSS